MPTPDFHRRFHPLTAMPFDTNESLPCIGLRPYVYCFWGNQRRPARLIIPDACADIIIRPDEKGIRLDFCPLDTRPFTSAGGQQGIFGVRFYCWALPYFVRGGGFDEEAFPGLRRLLAQSGFAQADFSRRQAIMEAYLMGRMLEAPADPGHLSAMDYLIRHHGRAAVDDLARHTAVSRRTLERRFQRMLGVAPKEMADIIRYQTLWRRILINPELDIQDQVEALGFYDQSHLLNAFRLYHGLSPRDAIALARPVAFFQDSGGRR